MIYPLKVQVAFAIIFTIFGIFIALAVEICHRIEFKNKIISLIMQIVVWFIVGYTLLKAMLTVSDGYVPIYAFLFFFIGYFIYYKLLKKDFSKKLNYINRHKGYVILIVFPKATFQFLRKILKGLKVKMKNVKIKKRKKYEANKENKNLSNNHDALHMDKC